MDILMKSKGILHNNQKEHSRGEASHQITTSVHTYMYEIHITKESLLNIKCCDLNLNVASSIKSTTTASTSASV